MRDAFLDLFGLPRSASEEDIKKRYRELVLKLHPDVNDSSNAEEQFRLVQKAYEYLTNEDKQMDTLYNSYKQSKQSTSPEFEMSPEEKRAEMRERARQFSRAAQKEAKEVEMGVFNMLTSKKLWMVVRFLAVCSILFGFILFIDFFLPQEGEMMGIKHKVYYSLFEKKTVFFADGSQQDVTEEIFLAINDGDSMSFEYSPIMHEFLGNKIWRQGKGTIFIDAKFNLFEFYPVIPLLFILPAFLFFYQENEVRFYLLYLATCVIYPGLLLHYTLKEDKLVYIYQYFSGFF
ncbi:MAG: hypothetical protein CL840_13435 [Crocinitomicaceae bacterium]|nr:hypothetical protein [Crocinitomicaceae bacterium]|tara:strand:- start:10767 stop:11633 length:867 start_codon:yes stop_codon:yes gene_type:complete